MAFYNPTTAKMADFIIEAIAWSWAAVVAFGIGPEILFHNKGYRGGAQGLLFNYRMGVYIDIKDIVDAGWLRPTIKPRS
ncbi:hypothetical protein [Methylobacter sp.]|uniref:hypothetical protein n=1 Tax=Methylobacter sp. TaxID=2051955 RepID=UPI002FDD12AC